MTTWWSLARETENAISASIATFTKDLWKEDSLTIETVKVIRKALDNVRVDQRGETVGVRAHVFKADGKVEETYGDLAVLVRILYADGDALEGVAFYEAKRRDWHKQKLPAKKRQLARMYRALWNGRLLVFDRLQAVSRLAELAEGPWWDALAHDRYPNVAVVTRALTMPLGPVLQSPRLDTSLYKFATPFASQLILRNLQGLDLDHEKYALDAAKGYAKEMAVIPQVVLSISVREGPEEPRFPHLNSEIFKSQD